MNKWWEELPTKAKDAATFLGWEQPTWDEDDYAKVPYYKTPLSQLSEKKKAAALYLGWEPLKSKPFCDDLWWDDVEPETKKQAAKLGYDKEKWDDDWAIHHLPIEHKYWKELTDDEKSGARYFGYTPATWDEVEDDLDAPFYDGDQTSDPTPSASGSTEEEKKEEMPDEECATDDEEWSDDDEEEDFVQVPAAAAEPEKKKQEQKKKKPVKTSRVFGGADLGSKFRTPNFRHIDKLIIHADRHVVKGIEIVSGNRTVVGSKDGNAHEFTLGPNEFIIKAEVRASEKSIQCLTFRTNKGRELGPCGGKGWLLGKDRAGDEFKIPAPFKYQLAGFQGTADEKHITSLAMSWGPALGPKKK